VGVEESAQMLPEGRLQVLQANEVSRLFGCLTRTKRPQSLRPAPGTRQWMCG
jgi:hypothetical protein